MCPGALICHVNMASDRAPAASILNLKESFMHSRMTVGRIKEKLRQVSAKMVMVKDVAHFY